MKLRVLALMHKELVPPDSPAESDLATADWKTEFHVTKTLREIGHDTHVLGVADDLSVIRQSMSDWKPHVAFNLLEVFHNVGVFDQNVVSFLELLRLPYTGCNPRGLMLARDKALSKQLLSYHRIPVPDFAVFPRGRKVKRPKRLGFPLIVKSLTQEASIGIAQASVVEDDQKLRDRVEFIHQSIGTDAIVESYIDGRELYVGVLGNQRLEVLPIWELLFTNMPEEARPIATERVKWSPKYQKKRGITSGEAKDLSPETTAQIQHVCKRVYRILQLSGYARIDLRLDPQGKIYVLEANPNPQLASDEDLADSAQRMGINYRNLLQRILNLGLRWRPESPG
jgi:D-alanine-D-alanine ligase